LGPNKEFEEWMYQELGKEFDEDIRILVHMPTFAVLKELDLRIFSKGDLDRIIKKYESIKYPSPKYQRAWEIVNEKGHKYFLNKLFER
jgi:hypothetical protein